MSKESAPYVTYDSGLEAKHLHLGNLVHDYGNPTSFEPYEEKSYTDIAEPPPAWAQVIHLDNYSLTLRRDAAEGSATSDRYHVVAAEKAVKIEIKNGKEFFNEITLKSNEAKKWLASRISAAEKLKESHPQPEIWLLTGLVLMTHATWSNISSKEHALVVGKPAPFDQLGVSALRRLSVSEGVKPAFGFRAKKETKEVEGTVIHETGKYPGMRGWAARWQKVDVKILPEGTKEGSVVNHLSLKVPNKVAVVEVGDNYAESQEEENEERADFNDEYWEVLLDNAEAFA